jgi:hypothetical protein
MRPWSADAVARITPAIIDDYQRDGVVMINGLLDPETTTSVMAW